MTRENYFLEKIAGDIIGFSYVFNNVKSLDFELFTNDIFLRMTWGNALAILVSPVGW